MTISTQLLLMDKINFHPTILGPSIMSTFKGLTRIRPLSCGFDSSVGRAPHWYRRGRGFESRSEPEIFSGFCSSSVTAALALMTVSYFQRFPNNIWALRTIKIKTIIINHDLFYVYYSHSFPQSQTLTFRKE